MLTPTTLPTPRTAHVTAAGPHAAITLLPAPLARAIAAHALVLGIAGDVLLRDATGGLGVPVWFALAGLALVAVTWRDAREVPRAATGWLAVAVLFAAAIAWRDAGELQFLDFLAASGALGMAAIALRDPRGGLAAERVRDLLWAVGRAARQTATGLVPLAPVVLRDLFTPNSARAGGAKPILRAATIAAVVLLVFGSLLRDADPIFASLIALPDFDVGVVISHVFGIGFFAWIAGGWAVAALGSDARDTSAPLASPLALGMLDLTAALGTLTALFAVFVIAQFGWFFGGERFLHERTGLSAAEYARQGFFQMVTVAALVVPLLLATRASLQPGRDLARRHTMLSLPLLALLGVMLVSAVLRLRLYVGYFGLTTDRLYALVFMAWLSLVLVLLATTVLRDRGRWFVAGALSSALLTLATLNVIAPDAIVARSNLARASLPARDGVPALDLRHLARLSGEATEIAVSATVAEPQRMAASQLRTDRDLARCVAAQTLLAQWGPESRVVQRRETAAAWRDWNAGESRAIAAVGQRTRDLQRIAAPCKPRPPRPPESS